jgi:hypothetical protein
MEELAEQTNAAMKAVLNFGDPFLTIEIIQVEKGEVIAESSSEPMSMQVRPRKLQVIGQPVAAGVGATHEEVPC